MNYCCTEFDIAIKDGTFDKNEDSTYNISGCSQCYVATNLKFCPFCGKQLEHRFEIQASNLHGYYVWLRDRTVGHFDTRAEAQEYVLLHRF